jgi:hypothetical protein
LGISNIDNHLRQNRESIEGEKISIGLNAGTGGLLGQLRARTRVEEENRISGGLHGGGDRFRIDPFS